MKIIDDIFNTITIIIAVPILILIIGLLIGSSYLYRYNVHNHYKNNSNIIFTYKAEDDIYNIVNNIYDKDKFIKVEVDKKLPKMSLAKITYYFKDEYNEELAKSEVSKLYEVLKNKKLKSDQLFGNTDNSIIELYFYKDDKFIYDIELKYYDKSGFDKKTYEEIINSKLKGD